MVYSPAPFSAIPVAHSSLSPTSPSGSSPPLSGMDPLQTSWEPSSPGQEEPTTLPTTLADSAPPSSRLHHLTPSTPDSALPGSFGRLPPLKSNVAMQTCGPSAVVQPFAPSSKAHSAIPQALPPPFVASASPLPSGPRPSFGGGRCIVAELRSPGPS
ncbi:hypothetical protein ROHU_016017 [Labeo rohita]|uniref:Uncharacterized protein n=1 Tax=Labeo rohita TaxID=84645 RepID=A0A498NLM2_LABRO|nr:hypothetical protein ROHU_016017 [Labeo rohita]